MGDYSIGKGKRSCGKCKGGRAIKAGDSDGKGGKGSSSDCPAGSVFVEYEIEFSSVAGVVANLPLLDSRLTETIHFMKSIQTCLFPRLQ